nr:MAG TPA: protein of unknown function (DUF1924) [Caudoviricetes sp.]
MLSWFYCICCHSVMHTTKEQTGNTKEQTGNADLLL